MQRREVVDLGVRHQLSSQPVVGGVQADRELEALPAELPQSVDALGPTDRAHGDLVVSEREAASIGQHVEAADQRIEIVERLAHPHEHQAGRPPRQVRGRNHDLADDLGCGEIARPAMASGLAELARHAAADLGRQAQALAALAVGGTTQRDPHHLDTVPAGPAELQHGLFRRGGRFHHVSVDARQRHGEVPVPSIDSGDAGAEGARIELRATQRRAPQPRCEAAAGHCGEACVCRELGRGAAENRDARVGLRVGGRRRPRATVHTAVASILHRHTEYLVFAGEPGGSLWRPRATHRIIQRRRMCPACPWIRVLWIPCL